MLARYWHVDRKHVVNLIDAGEIKWAIDLRAPSSNRSTIRIPRSSVVAFLSTRVIRVAKC